MSTGAKPKAMPWRAATKPAAQHKDAPVPQRMPATGVSGPGAVELDVKPRPAFQLFARAGRPRKERN